MNNQAYIPYQKSLTEKLEHRKNLQHYKNRCEKLYLNKEIERYILFTWKQ